MICRTKTVQLTILLEAYYEGSDICQSFHYTVTLLACVHSLIFSDLCIGNGIYKIAEDSRLP